MAAFAADILGVLSLGLLILALTGEFPFSGVYPSLFGVIKIGPKPTVWVCLFALAGLARIAIRQEGGRISGLILHPTATRLFLIALFMYNVNGRQIGAVDTIAARLLPYSILQEGNFDLDEFRFLHARGIPNWLSQVRGHLVSIYPPGPAITALPFYLIPVLAGVPPESKLVTDVEKLAASTLTALSAALLYALLRRLAGEKAALVLTVIYAFGTSSLSVSSQALWQHGPSQLLLVASLYCLVRGREEPNWAVFSGFTLGWAVVCRPTDLLVAIPLALYVFHLHRKEAWLFIFLTLPSIVFMGLYLHRYFGPTIRIGYDQGFYLPGEWNTPFLDGLAGILISPSRGLLIYSPILLCSMRGIYIAWRDSGHLLYRYLSVAVALVIALYSRWGQWWGGWTFGPRMLADLTPLLTILIVPAYPRLVATAAARHMAYGLTAFSIVIHALGAFAPGVWNPGGTPQLNRLWSWADGELAYRSRLWLHKLIGIPRPRELPIVSLTADRAHYRHGEPVRMRIVVRGADSETLDLYLTMLGPDAQHRFIGPSGVTANSIPLLSPVPPTSVVERNLMIALPDDWAPGLYKPEWWLYRASSLWGADGLINRSRGQRLILGNAGGL